VGNFIGELQIWDNIKYRISYGADLSFWGNDGYNPKYYLRNGQGQTFSSVWSSKNEGLVWQLENVLSYDKTIGEHSFSIILGTSAKQSSGSYVGGSRNHIINYNRPYIDASTGQAANGDMTSSGAPSVKNKLASYFGRVSYNFAERYMLQATLRRDGSSRFGSNNHWATFPSVSVGWNIMNEPFLRGKANWLNNAKLRASWGKNGNENIGDFQYIALASSGNNYIFGKEGQVVIGTKPTQLPNPDLRWEESRQTDIGLDLGFLSNRFTLSVDYFVKDTDGMLMTLSLPQYVGEAIPVGNVGKMRNSGVEMDFGYRQNFGELSIRLGANASWLKNKLISYGNDQGWANLDSFQGTGTITRAENGLPFPYFYGYRTDGIIQNLAEANAYNSKYGTSLVPGDVRYVDVDQNGTIDENDRTKIGKGMPDWTYGVNLTATWRGFDFYIFFQGAAGNDIFDATRRIDALASNLPSYMLNRWTGEVTSNTMPRFVLASNLPSYMLNRWTGEGTSNTMPRFVQADPYNWQSSDLMVYDGSYFRLKNIQLGYTLPEKITRKAFISKFRVYVAAENLKTWTKYHGFDPEISSGGTSLGIDYGVYPQARVWTVGCNLSF